MISAAEARAKINIDNSLTLKAIEQQIEQAVEKAITDLKTSTIVYLKKHVEKIGQDQLIQKLSALGYTVKYSVYNPPQWDSGDTQYSFTISW